MTGIRFLPPATACLALLCVTWGASVGKGEWFSQGDRVVTIAETQVTERSRTLATLPAGTNLRVQRVHGGSVNVTCESNGETITGWVRESDLMKLDRNHRAVYATKDDLVRGQGQVVRLPQGLPVHIRLRSDTAVDVFIIAEDAVDAYRQVMQEGSGRVTSLRRALNTRTVDWSWTPPNDGLHYVLIDNSSFPDGGANSGRTIHYTMAYCIDDPTPVGPRSGRGLLLGRATLAYDNYEGRQGRHREPYTVVVEVLDDENEVVDTLEAPADSEGYFFVENVPTNRRYRVQKLDSSTFAAPVTVAIVHRFAAEGEAWRGMTRFESGRLSPWPTGTSSVLDLGNVALRVAESGRIQTRHDGPGFFASNMDGRTTVGGTGLDVPLDRHQWFLDKFPADGWAEMVMADREAIDRAREDAEKDKPEEEEEPDRREEQDPREEEEDTEAGDHSAEPADDPAPPAESSPPPPVPDFAVSREEPEHLRNVALAANGARATAISTGRYLNQTMPPERAIDGDRESGWASHWHMPAWLNRQGVHLP